MKALCADCGQHRDVEPFTGLCVDCLIARAKRAMRPIEPEPEPFDHKIAAAGGDREE